jgi:hypothetical protein
MVIDVTSVFAAYFARNQGPDPNKPEQAQPPDYGVVASLEGAIIALELTFRRGSAYCCYEYGCHLNLYSGKRWKWLRRELEVRKIVLPSRLELRLTVVVEGGALFFDLSKPDPTRRGWYAFASAEARRYGVDVLEAANLSEPYVTPNRPRE